jgi:hypothetical protein
MKSKLRSTLLALFVALFMVFTAMPIVALAQETQPNDSTLDNGSAYIQASPIVTDDKAKLFSH